MLRSIWRAFLDMIFPKICVACDGDLLEGEEEICTHCRYHLPFTNFHTDRENTFKGKFYGKVPIEYALSFLRFQKLGKVQNLIHALKYKGNQKIGLILGEWYGNQLKTSGFEQAFDIILPIPLHPKKLKKRGYNQSDSFAQGLSIGLNVSWSSTTIIRTKATNSQTRKSRIERFKNVENIFQVVNEELITDKRILLVDDVVTTGATLTSCIETLNKHSPQSISVATIAIAE